MALQLRDARPSLGKSMAAKMLCAYYDHSCDSRELFADLEIASDPSFEEHLNKYPVIFLDMTSFVARSVSPKELTSLIQQRVREEILATYPEVKAAPDDDLMDVLTKVSQHYDTQFIMIIDEWDAICREALGDEEALDRYVNLLRRMFKEVNANRVFAGVYMTGILPIKKYRTELALNNFLEYSMVMPRQLAKYYGFTKDEVKALATKHGMNFDELEKWYDGYQIGNQPSMFNSNSVMEALISEWCESYWGRTGAYDAVADYINMNYEGLKDNIIYMLAGGRCGVNPKGFRNDLAEITSRDDVLTVLIHLGYLSYDRVAQECYIPNREVAGEMEQAIASNRWKPVVDALEMSKQLMRSLLDGDAEAVARGVEAVHDESTSILSYNNENSLSCVISLAFYYARNDYVIHREYASDKGFADLVLIPRRNVSKPAVVIDLKCNKDAVTAIDQIKQKSYPAKVAEYLGNLLLVGISYDRETKQHSCRIEKA